MCKAKGWMSGGALLAAALVAGCATTAGDGAAKPSGGIPMELRSGFLEDYSKLQPVPEEKGKWRWIAPDIDRARYRRFMVDPVEARVPPGYRDEVQPKPEVVARVTKYFREAIIRELRTRYEVVDEPGAGVARISVAITAIQPSARELQAWQYLPIALVVAGVAEAAGAREKNVVVYMEAEITDSLNGKLLAEVLQGRVAEQGGVRRIEDVRPETITPVLDFWAREGVRHLDAIKRGAER